MYIAPPHALDPPPIKHRNAGREEGGRKRGRDGERKLESEGKMIEN